MLAVRALRAAAKARGVFPGRLPRRQHVLANEIGQAGEAGVVRGLRDGVVERHVGGCGTGEIFSVLAHRAQRGVDGAQVVVGAAQRGHFGAGAFHHHAQLEQLGRSRAALQFGGHAPYLAAGHVRYIGARALARDQQPVRLQLCNGLPDDGAAHAKGLAKGGFGREPGAGGKTAGRDVGAQGVGDTCGKRGGAAQDGHR